jgi:drug/metabolite transporter (DMT)-like permease
MIPYFIIGVKVLSLGSLAIYSMIMMLGGMLVPFFYGVLFLKETLTPGRIFGTVLLSLCIVLQALLQKNNGNQTATKGKNHIFLLLCIVIFLLNGMTGVIAKAHEISEKAVDEISFSILSCAITAAISLVFLLFGGMKTCNALKETFRFRPLLIMIFLGVAAYTGNFLHLKAASFVPASVQFPLVSGGVIVLSALASKLIFKEKISSKEWISVAGAFVSTLLFAF